MKILITTLFHSLPALFNVWVFLSFIFFLFGIFGLQIFIGQAYSACRTTLKPVNATYWPIEDLTDGPCNMEKPKTSCKLICGHPMEYGMSLEDDMMDQRPTIQYGINTFKHFLDAINSVLQTITLDNWSQLMFNIIDASFLLSGHFFYILLVVLGSFFLLNLILAVIMQSFKILHDAEKENEKYMRIRDERLRKKKEA